MVTLGHAAVCLSVSQTTLAKQTGFEAKFNQNYAQVMCIEIL